jgi:hypothetical protein
MHIASPVAEYTWRSKAKGSTLKVDEVFLQIILITHSHSWLQFAPRKTASIFALLGLNAGSVRIHMSGQQTEGHYNIYSRSPTRFRYAPSPALQGYSDIAQ